MDDSYEPSKIIFHHDSLYPEFEYHHGQPAPPIRPLSPPTPIVLKTVSSTSTSTSQSTINDNDVELSQDDQSTFEKYANTLAIADMDNGLSDIVIDKQRAEYGYNETIEKQTSLWFVFLLKFWGVTPIMIMIAMIIAFALGNYIDGGVIGFLLFINGLIAFHEDVKARKSLAQLVQKLQIKSRVLRDGKWLEIASRELVPGDLVRVRTGDISGADMILVNGDLSVDVSALTGESALKTKKRGGILHAGAIIKRGEANAVVVATGPATYFGETAALVQSSAPNAHINNILTRIVVVLMSIVLILVIISLIVISIKGDNLIDALPLLLMVIVTALPVALPAMFTVSMALGSQELSKRAVLVTRLNVLEDAAMMSLLFSDKTGTLTENHLTVREIYPLYPEYTSTDVLFTATLCSRIENSDPIDAAILEAYHQLLQTNTSATMNLYHDINIQQYQPQHFIPFDATNRRTEATLCYDPSAALLSHQQQHQQQSQQQQQAHVSFQFHVTKGAVATLCRLCKIPEGSDEWKRIDNITTTYASKGYRTLAVCHSHCHSNHQHPHPHPVTTFHPIDHSTNENDPLLHNDDNRHIHPSFQLIGVLALYDPPRVDSHNIISNLLTLGIQTKMLTGDAMGVACEMGHLLGLGRDFVNLEQEKHILKTNQHVMDIDINMDGRTSTPPVHDSHTTSDSDMLHLLSKYDPLTISGFAQIFPSDKHYIVKHTQNRGLICGMTGDGVNDAPALKQAEVGCAVSNATDVAKGCASALLLNDGLSGVVDMVSVGRQIHRRVEVWFMNKVAKAAQQAIFILVLFLILGRFPISALQVVILLLLMDFVLISLATDIQTPGTSPARWNLGQLTRIGLVVGLLGAGEMMALIFTAEWVWNFTIHHSQTFAWECMFYWGMFSVFSVRERRAFWTSKPSTIMVCIVVVESILVWIVCAVGASDGFEGIGWGYSSMLAGIAAGCFVLNDAVKTIYIRTFERDILG